jgi:S1-C subfamily serine protease
MRNMSPVFIYQLVSRKVPQISNMRLNIFFLSFLFICSPNSNTQSLSAEQIYKKVSGAVVVIYAYDDNDKLAAQGSGVVLNDKGYVVTNYHVLSGNKRLEILHGKENIPYVDIIGIDVEKDILILKIKAKKFPAIKIGNSNSVNIGQRIYAIGSPMGLENSISEGIISGLRSYDESKRSFIQITAGISPGSSGGAVVNDKGELIGISTLTMKEGQNLNFAIPIDDILKVEIGSYSKNETYKDFELLDKGDNAFKNGDYKESIKYYSLYLKKYPKDAKAYFNRGVAKAKLEDYRGAINDYNNALELNPKNESAYLFRGYAKQDLENYQGAIQDYNKGIEINPDDADLYCGRGDAKNSLKDNRGAVQDYTTAIELNPNFAYAYLKRGFAKHELGDYNGGCLDWSKAGELGLDNAYKYITQYCQ